MDDDNEDILLLHPFVTFRVAFFLPHCFLIVPIKKIPDKKLTGFWKCTKTSRIYLDKTMESDTLHLSTIANLISDYP